MECELDEDVLRGGPTPKLDNAWVQIVIMARLSAWLC